MTNYVLGLFKENVFLLQAKKTLCHTNNDNYRGSFITTCISAPDGNDEDDTINLS